MRTRIAPGRCLAAPVAQMAEAGGLNPLQHGFESHRGHCIGLPRSPSSLGADRALQPAAFLVARRRKNVSARSSSERRRAIRGCLTASLAPKVVRNDMRHADAACCLRPLCVRKRSASNLTALSKQGRKGRPSVFSKLFAVRQSRR